MIYFNLMAQVVVTELIETTIDEIVGRVGGTKAVKKNKCLGYVENETDKHT